MKYIKPSVRKIDGSTPNLGYFLWLKSRQWIITDLEGNKFMVDLYPTSDWELRIPDKFKVGNEEVTRESYSSRINNMNLQYNNFENYVYEIQGSCLFRDILFNINKISAWAQSNRFLFSILDEESITDEDSYAVSSEYEGIKEWEDQFDNYMNAILVDKVVDHNRIEMPYSISSTFWIGVNKKTILDLLSFLRKYTPFFYEVYGRQFGFSESEIPNEPSAGITQYILKDPDEFTESKFENQGTQIINTKMGLILYSQFIRQADTRCVGLFNEVMHENPDKFIHKVFKGGTILNVHYVADIDKVMSTVRTRLCAFAMSSGDDPCSWSYFINKFLPDGLSPREFIKYLPCKFDGSKLTECKFLDDVKFRNEGLERSNCPCPLYSGSIDDALTKKLRDKNKIGDYYFDLTKYLGSDGLMYSKYAHSVWTSRLLIESDSEISDTLFDLILSKLESIKLDYLTCNKTGSFCGSLFELSKYFRYFPNGDCTSAMKGYAIDLISKMLIDRNVNSFLIDFGGDIFIHNANPTVSIDGSKFNIETTVGDWSIFTSGNTTKRGNHIIGCNENELSVLVVKWNKYDPSIGGNCLSDIITTKFASNEEHLSYELGYKLNSLGCKFNTYRFRVSYDNGVSEFSLLDRTYCASPFFNPDQVKIRDYMVSRFDNAFRPDLSKESLEYEEHKDDESVKNLVDSNRQGILSSKCLVFPMNTNDLGTLWEVGCALSHKVTIIKYNEDSDSYSILPPFEGSELESELNEDHEPDSIYLFDCSNKSDVISMGYLSERIPSDMIYYLLNGCNDNIMLSVNYHHVELINNELIEYERDSEDHDQ
jgi:nucleoside 2-deoxyribosyltransferase